MFVILNSSEIYIQRYLNNQFKELGYTRVPRWRHLLLIVSSMSLTGDVLVSFGIHQ